MRSTIIALAFAATCAVPALAAGERAFTVSNTNPKASVVRLWYTQSGSGKPDLEIDLKYPIGPNARSTFTVSSGDYCLYDVRLKFDDGVEQQTRNVNVCRGGGVTAS